ncbi:elicitin-like protein [Phytophthora cinnamomi]|uniref:elicitin-like protein n=1 Tax=Phytophthora cinnamomi TaxID=4785 RepID=UPI00355AC585|nr:elicitin-like protein [Phytophthora cinnamomi]
MHAVPTIPLPGHHSDLSGCKIRVDVCFTIYFPPSPQRMQTTFMFTVLVIGLLALLFPTTIDGALCNSTELAVALEPLYTCENYTTCSSDVGTALPFTAPPTTAQLTAMCSSAACRSLTPVVKGLDLPDCEVIVNGVAYNVQLVRARRVQQCSSPSLSSSITASVASSEDSSAAGA